MAKFTIEQLAAMARPASVTEEQKLENIVRLLRCNQNKKVKGNK